MKELYGGTLPGELWPILDTVLDAVIVLSKDGRVVAWNGLAEYTFGWTSSEACGRKLSDLIIPPEHRASHEEGMVRLHGGGKKLTRIVLIWRDFGIFVPIQILQHRRVEGNQLH